MHQEQKGMTLLEMMLTLALSALLLGLATPPLSQFVSNQRITAATNEMMAHLQFARMQAITRNRTVIACPSRDHQTCSGNRWDRGWMVFQDPDRNNRPDGIEDVLRIVGADEQIQITSGGRFRVRFQPTGGAYGSNLTIRVCARRSEIDGRAVVVSNTGRVRLQSRLPHRDCIN